MNDFTGTGTTLARPAAAGSTSCLVACIKNEGRYILEWIAFHKVQGFTEIAIYDNASSDGTFALLAPLAERGEIYLERVEDRPEIAPQIDAYQREMRRTSATEWVMFADADEFIVLREPITFDEFLASFPSDVSQICLNWRIFGSSGKTRRTDELVIERFLRASRSDAKPNRQGKSVARRSRIISPGIHASKVTGPTVHDDGSPAEMPKSLGITTRVSHARAAVHHYIVKSHEEFIEKMNRGIGTQPVGALQKYRGDRDWYWEVHDLNDEFNDEALNRIDDVRREIDRLRAITRGAKGPADIVGDSRATAADVGARIAASLKSLDGDMLARAASIARRLDSLAKGERGRAAEMEAALKAREVQLLAIERPFRKAAERLQSRIRELRAADRRGKPSRPAGGGPRRRAGGQ